MEVGMTNPRVDLSTGGYRHLGELPTKLPAKHLLVKWTHPSPGCSPVHSLTSERILTVPTAPGAVSVRVWHITSRGWDPWTERPLPEVVRVAYPPDAVHNHLKLLKNDFSC